MGASARGGGQADVLRALDRLGQGAPETQVVFHDGDVDQGRVLAGGRQFHAGSRIP
jgi:hypothetical protein